MDWEQAENHLRATIKAYEELVGAKGDYVIPVLVFVIQPLLKRFIKGERTRKLYEAIMALE